MFACFVHFAPGSEKLCCCC